MLNNFLKLCARKFGFDVRRFQPHSSAAAQIKAMLEHHKVNLVIDVGANEGQYGFELRSHVGYCGKIVSFEPVKSSYERLYKAASKDKLWLVGDRVAIGAKAGNVTMNISCNSVSSSILPMLDSHSNVAPDSRYISTELVPLVALDSIIPTYIEPETILFLKIDTQGYESEVLKGAEQTLKRAVGVQMELSLIPLYDGQALMPDLISSMSLLGFNLWGISPTFADSSSGRMLQVDATFFRA